MKKNNKSLNYYLNKPWEFDFEIAPEGGYYARVKGLYCHSYGENLEEAVKNIKEALEGHIESYLQDGDPVPEPEYFKKATGRLSIRTSKSMHSKLERIAKEEDVSISHLVNDALVKRYG